MQDNYTGEMHALDMERFLREIPVRTPGPGDPFGKIMESQRQLEALERAKDHALPKERQGAVLAVGEELTIKGGRFVVTSIVKEGVFLKGLPVAQEQTSPGS
jgi:hypothetical protein